MYIMDRWAQDEGAANYERWESSSKLHCKPVCREMRIIPMTRRRTDHGRPARADAFEQVAYYSDVFSNGRNEYAIQKARLAIQASSRDEHLLLVDLVGGITNRPGQDVTYTQNWPHEELVGNRPTGTPLCGA